MSEDVKVTCDGCGADITTRTNSIDYRLVLATESKPGYGSGNYTDMMIYPPIEHAHHFCGLGCLDHWTDRRRHRELLNREWHEKWKAEHGSQKDNGVGGSFFSYMAAPREVLDIKNAEIEVAALAAFPMKRAP